MTNARFTADERSSHMAMYAAAVAAIGVVTSGPLALAIVGWVRPQPAWVDARTFAAHFHPVQVLPFVCGLLLVFGFLALIASMHALSSDEQRARHTCALAFASVFAALISFNYVVQTSFVPALARDYDAASAPVISAFSMAHPGSLAWSLEMWGYAFLGIAGWLVAPFFRGSAIATFTRRVFVLNGPVSIASAVWSALRPGWESSGLGLWAFVAWNVLALLMAASAFVVFRQRVRGYVRPRRHFPPGLAV